MLSGREQSAIVINPNSLSSSMSDAAGTGSAMDEGEEDMVAELADQMGRGMAPRMTEDDVMMVTEADIASAIELGPGEWNDP